MRKKILAIAVVFASAVLPHGSAQALQMPTTQEMTLYEDFTARSYVVLDAQTGAVLLSKDPQRLWVPASLTKLVTVLVVLDAKPNLKKSVAMIKADEVGGARIATAAGVKYTVGDLLHATLIASANNAANALARSTGLSGEEFVRRMNEKARELGAAQTVFYEPTGINEHNMTTAEDYAKIVKAAFVNPTVVKIAQLQNYSFRSTNNGRYKHSIKNTNKLLADREIGIIGGKTGYLDESRYNFVADIKDPLGNDFIVVLLGSASSATQFQETKKLAALGGLAKAFFNFSAGSALGLAPGGGTGGLSMQY